MKDLKWKKQWMEQKGKVVMLAVIIGLLIFSIFASAAITKYSTQFNTGAHYAASNGISPVADISQGDYEEELNNQLLPVKNLFNAIMISVGVAVIVGVALFFGVKNGLQWMSSEDAEARKKAKISLFNLLIGIVVALCVLGIATPLINGLSTQLGLHLVS